MDYTEKKLQSINSYQGRIVNVTMELAELPDGGTAFREVVHHPGGVCVLPVDENGVAYCVRQYRYPCEAHLLEAPAGKLEPGEAALPSAIRELSEETGLAAGQLIDLGAVYSSPGFCTELLHLYLALDLKRGEAHPDPGEFLDVVAVPLDALYEQVLRNEIADGKTALVILRAKAYLDRK